MSDYFVVDGGNFVELNYETNFINKIIMMFNVYQFDFLVAFLGFYMVRYLFPNTILGNDQSMKVGLTLAFFYAILGFFRSSLIDYKKELDITSWTIEGVHKNHFN